ncbi:acyl carrier protein [Bosea beijingensis]|uniref:acyl carrier protein n=1 Tax=Bosea beijingensis TaxID=3068632 RepID=UPI0027405653|nr:acyl carrier protein [Bosea sp. REN20]
MSSEAQTITVDFLIGMLKQVIAENPSRDRGKLADVAWGPETLLEDTGFNSYDFVEIIFKLEDHFGIEIDYNANNDINDVKTIGQLCNEVAKLLAKKQVA